MPNRKQEIINWLCSESNPETLEEKYQHGLSLIQQYHANKSYVLNLAGMISEDKKQKMEYELSKIAGFTLADYQEKIWLLESPSESEQKSNKDVDPVCPGCGEPYTPEEGGNNLCPECLKKKEIENATLNRDIMQITEPPTPGIETISPKKKALYLLIAEEQKLRSKLRIVPATKRTPRTEEYFKISDQIRQLHLELAAEETPIPDPEPQPTPIPEPQSAQTPSPEKSPENPLPQTPPEPPPTPGPTSSPE